jgi:hypothetical protein
MGKSLGVFLALFAGAVLGVVPLLAPRSGEAAGPAAPAPPAPSFDRNTVPARGAGKAILTVPAFGRFAVFAKSAKGTALRIVDRMAGPGEIVGIPGEEDGRVDLFLEAADYMVVTNGSENGSGEARLDARGFRERNAPMPPAIPELKPIRDRLDDFEQLSYWLEIKEHRRVALEAAGRNLSDLRLWKDGTWLVEASPERETLEPFAGRPLRACRIAADLEPGLYLVTAYGGRPLPWTEKDEEHPFYLQYGIPKLGAAGRQRFAIGPLGLDRWRVPGVATFFRMELPEARKASFRVGTYSESSPFSKGGSGGEIEKNSVPPAAETDVHGGDARSEHIVTVHGEPGQPYVLQHFTRLTGYTFRESGEYWVSTVQSGHPGDAVDATGIVVRRRIHPGGSPPEREPFLKQVVEIDRSRGFARRANLLGTLTLFLRVGESGKYEILSRGTQATYRIEPFLTWRPPTYQPPPFQGTGSIWDLEAGYYVLTAVPEKKGILDVAIRPKGLLVSLLDSIGSNRDPSKDPVRAQIRFPKVHLGWDYQYTLYLSQAPEVKAGVILRKLPVDLSDPLPLSPWPGETVTIPALVADEGTVRAESDDGTLLDLSVDGAPWRKTAEISPGTHSVAVRNPGKETVACSVSFRPKRLAVETPLPRIPDNTLVTLPDFPVLSDRETRYADFPREGTATFAVRADRPGLYRLETTGLLATKGNLRNRVSPSLFNASQNGVGRNFLLHGYLRGGKYQVTVAVEGASAGHAGVRLTRSEPLDGGELQDGIPARIALSAGQAVVYRFRIAEAGTYRLRTLGLGRTFPCRLEDGDGWPIEKPGQDANMLRRFEPGDYHLFLLPEGVESRRLTLLEKIPVAPVFLGHGPHRLPLSTRIVHLWREPQGGGDRTPDAWEFELPAEADASVVLTNEMEGELARIGTGGTIERIAPIPPERGWSGLLQAGRYRLIAVSSRRDNLLAYDVEVTTSQLLPGQSRSVPSRMVVPLSLGPSPAGTSGLAEIWSFGAVDARARLYDSQGKLVAENDDRPGDWNFHLMQRLPAGRYTLRLDPVGPPHKAVPLPESPAPEWKEIPPESAEATVEEAPDGQRVEEESSDGAEPPAPAAVPAPARAPHRKKGLRQDVSPGDVTVFLEAPSETMETSLSVPGGIELSPGRAVHLFPLAIPADAEFLLVSARSAENIGLSLETAAEGADEASWRTLGTDAGGKARLEVPIVADGGPAMRYRLRVWSSDRRGNPLRIEATVLKPKRIDETALAAGVLPEPSSASSPAVGIVAVSLSRPGLFRLDEGRYSPGRLLPCRPAEAGIAVASGSVLWIVRDIAPPSEESPRPDPLIKAARIALSPEYEGGLALALPYPAPATIDVSGPQKGPLLVEAAARDGQPGVILSEASTIRGTSPAGRGMAVGDRSAIAVSLRPREPAVLLWRADAADNPPYTLFDVKLRAARFPEPVPAKTGWGVTSGALAATSSWAGDLPAGAKRLRVSLGGTTAAALSRGDDVVQVFWAGGEPFEETVNMTAEAGTDRLTLLHRGAGEERFTVEVLPLLDKEKTSLAPDSAWEVSAVSAGRIRLPVEGRKDGSLAPYTLHIRGASSDPVLVTKEGRVHRGTDLPLGAGGGTLLVPHGPGFLLAWSDRPGGSSAFLLGSAAPKDVRVALPSRVPLAGAAMRLRLSMRGPAVLHLRAPTPAVTLVRRGTGSGDAEAEDDVEVHKEAVLLDAYLPDGPADLILRGMGGRELTGIADLMTTPVVSIGEGLGPETLLPSGSARFFAFRVTRNGPVGVGVRSDGGEVVECVLMTASGKKLGTGVIQMHDLKPGTYLLALKTSADAPPQNARPALAGVEPPGDGPPPEVAGEYIEKARRDKSLDDGQGGEE